jgi:uncharacterized membrane protein YgcG
MKRTIFACLAGSLVLPMLFSAPAFARKSGTTREQCSRALAREARDRFDSYDFELLSNEIREVSSDENLMVGTAQAGRRVFRYECIYNVRTERTYGIAVRAQGGGGNGGGWGGGNGGGFGGGWSGGGRLPGGSWARSCRSAEMRGGVLYAECKNRNGKWRDAQIIVRSCPADRLGNQNGQLACE